MFQIFNNLSRVSLDSLPFPLACWIWASGPNRAWWWSMMKGGARVSPADPMVCSIQLPQHRNRAHRWVRQASKETFQMKFTAPSPLVRTGASKITVQRATCARQMARVSFRKNFVFDSSIVVLKSAQGESAFDIMSLLHESTKGLHTVWVSFTTLGHVVGLWMAFTVTVGS